MWQPIATHPREEQLNFLIWMPTETPELAVALWDSEGGLYFAEEIDVEPGLLEELATHWMPMPAPPTD